MHPSPAQLLSAARKYWPALKAPQLEQESTPEFERLQALWEKELEQVDRWWTFLDEIEKKLPGFTIGDATATPDASFRCIAYPGERPPRRFAVVGCISIIAPVFTVYGLEFEYVEGRRSVSKVCFEPLPTRMRIPADIIAREIEATFESSAPPREIAELPIPLFVQRKEPPDTRLFHALFASQPERVP
ncbi:MAG TPA: hypothetical protein VLQ93_11910 [Myxococcaceae bacterium]|nr:hypothetical protein [Myxococcaceae bacterium]